MGFYQVVRYIGFSLGSALAAAILAAHTTGTHPSLHGYVVALWVSVVVCALAGVVAWVLPGRTHASSESVQDAELAGAGLVGVEEGALPRARRVRAEKP